MLQKLALVFAGAAGLLVVGCQNDDFPNVPLKDFSVMRDMAGVITPGGDDMNVMQGMYTPTTSHGIDSDPGSGPLKMGTLVSVPNLVVVGRIGRHLDKTNGYCQYTVPVVDATCAAPPCGLVLFAQGSKLPVLDASTTDCPFPNNTKIPFAMVRFGDNVDVTGKVEAFRDSKAPMTVVHHEITVDSAKASATKAQIPAPLPITDPTMFVAHTGSGWNMYEGTYVTVIPTGRKLTVGTVDTFGDYTTLPDMAQWDGSNYFGPKDAGTWPMSGSTWTSISGIVLSDFGGSVSPIQDGDYTP